MNLIPENVSISTMSLTCSLGTAFNVANIYNSYITPATETTSMNALNGGGQGFSLLADYSGTGGYKPTSQSFSSYDNR